MVKQENRLFWILTLLCVISLLLFLGMSLFNTKGEPREAVVALSMLKYGNWTLPVNNGVDIAYKPPLLHWCIALFSLVQGYVSEYTSRLPSALSLILMVLVAYKANAKNSGNAMVAFLAGLITITNFEVHRAGMACRVDMLLSSLIVVSIYLLFGWYKCGQKGYVPWLAILAMSGAFLTKGPIGVLLPCLVMGVYMLCRGEHWLHILSKFVLIGLLSCILPSLWYMAAYRQGGDNFLSLVLEENVLRFTGKMTYSSHEQPVYYNFITLLAGFAPYTLLCLFSLFVLKYKRMPLSGSIKSMLLRLKKSILGLSDLQLVSLLSIVIIFVFYCIPKSKRSVYLLPIYPFIAYFLANYLVYLSRRYCIAVKLYGYILSALALLLPVAFIAIQLSWMPSTVFTGKHAAENISYLSALHAVPFNVLTIVILLLLVGTAVSFWYWRNRGAYSLSLSVVSIAFVVLLSLDALFLPAIMRVKSDYDVAMSIRKIVPQGVIYDYREGDSVEDHDRMHSFTINFYLNDRVCPLDNSKPNQGYILIGDNDITSFKTAHKDFLLKKIKRFDHKSCDDKRYITLFALRRVSSKP